MYLLASSTTVVEYRLALQVCSCFGSKTSGHSNRVSFAEMLQSIRAVAEYVNTSRLALGPGEAMDRLEKNQFENLKVLLTSTKCKVDEASSVMKALSSGSDGIQAAFSEDQRKALAGVIAAATNAGAVALVQPATIRKVGTQAHLHMHHYLTRADWSILVDGVRIDQKLEVIVNRALQIGCTNPSELSVVAFIAIVAVAGRITFGPDESHALVVEYKRMNKLRRNSFAQSCASFPRSVHDFLITNPDAYDPSDPPVECLVSSEAIEQRRLGMAARKTHKTLSPTSSTQIAMGSTSSSNIQECMALMANAMMRMQSQAPGGGAREALPLVTLARPTPPKRRNGLLPPLALTDASQGGDAADAALGNNTDDQEAGSLKTLGEGSTPALARKGAQPGGEELAQPGGDGPGEDGSKPELSLDDMIADMQKGLKRKRDENDADAEVAAGPHGEARGKGKAKAAAATLLKKPAIAPKKVHAKTPKGAKPSICVEWSRSHVLARTGMSGPGQTKTFKFKGENTAGATKSARSWLVAECKRQKINFE